MIRKDEPRTPTPQKNILAADQIKSPLVSSGKNTEHKSADVKSQSNPRPSMDGEKTVAVGDPGWRRKSRIDIIVDSKFLAPPTLRRSNGLPRSKQNEGLANVHE
jgi:hypothetical protein